MSDDPYLPPEQRRQILREYGQRLGLRVFIETGTNNGDTPAALMDAFDVLFTIEVGKDLYLAACERFRDTNVVCLHGDSAELLAEQLIRIDEPVLMWLDGHFCGDARAHKDTPIIEELEGIFGVARRRAEMGVRPLPHVILIDDARLFEGMSHYGEHDWPHIDEIRKLAEDNGYGFELADDIVRLVPKAAFS